MSSSFGNSEPKYGIFDGDSFNVFDIQDGRIVGKHSINLPVNNLEQYWVVFTPDTPADLYGFCYGDLIIVAVKTSPTTHSIYQIDDDGCVSKERDVDRAVSSTDIGVYFDLVFNDITELERFVYPFPENEQFFESELGKGRPPTSPVLTHQ
jgi:hypothetical protein